MKKLATIQVNISNASEFSAEENLKKHELSGKEPIKKVLVLQGNGLDKTHVKKMLSEMGFNVRIVVGNRHHADLVAIMVINGFWIPGWEFLIKFVAWLSFSGLKKIFLAKFTPGKERLHLRLFLSIDKKKWVITAHTDWNWITLNLLKPIRSHLMKGMGDYQTGTLMAHRLFKLFFQRQANNKGVTYDEIVKVTRWAYYESMVERLGYAGTSRN